MNRETRDDKTSKSTVHRHEQAIGHLMNFDDVDDVEIIDVAETKVKLATKEALHILKCKPTLNKQLNSQQSFD